MAFRSNGVRSNGVSVKWPFGQIIFGQTAFGQMVFRRVWHFEKLHISKFCITKFSNVGQCLLKQPAIFLFGTNLMSCTLRVLKFRLLRVPPLERCLRLCLRNGFHDLKISSCSEGRIYIRKVYPRMIFLKQNFEYLLHLCVLYGKWLLNINFEFQPQLVINFCFSLRYTEVCFHHLRFHFVSSFSFYSFKFKLYWWSSAL
jgi:hypothetical protein